MASLGTALFLALDALSVSAAVVSRGLAGPRLAAFRRVPLAPGAVAASASSRNVLRPEDARRALAEALAGVGAPAGPAVLVLPDGVARVALLGLPPDADARELVRFRLASSLPWDAAETVVDALAAGRGQVVGAAVRRATVVEHEQAAAAAGAAHDRVHLAPLLGLEPLLRGGAAEGVHVLVGDAAATFVVVRDGGLRAVHSRRRDASAGEAVRLVEEAARVARRLDGAPSLPVAFVGPDAAALRRDTARAGARLLPARDAEPGRPAWLESVLA